MMDNNFSEGFEPSPKTSNGHFIQILSESSKLVSYSLLRTTQNHAQYQDTPTSNS
jgi:hypothetical protein